jgi:hypothetical protein
MEKQKVNKEKSMKQSIKFQPKLPGGNEKGEKQERSPSCNHKVSQTALVTIDNRRNPFLKVLNPVWEFCVAG